MRQDPIARPSFGGLVMVALLALVLWGVTDLYAPRRVDIRVFDPVAVARLDNAMWRAYYDKKPVPLYFEMAELLRKQFHFPYLRSYVAAYDAAHAAFVFKAGHARADYLEALPQLERYFHAIHSISVTPFDEKRAAQLELEWWIVHRERSRNPGGALERTLADAGAELYRVPASSLAVYAGDRARAMVLRDTSAVRRKVTEAEWRRIEELLRSSWRSLSDAVRPRS